MNCSEFELELDRLIESRSATLAPAAQSHCAECADCQGRWREYRLIETAILAWLPVTCPPTLADAVLAELKSGGSSSAGVPSREESLEVDRLTDGVVLSEGVVVSSPNPVKARRRLSTWGAVMAAASLLLVLGIGLAWRPPVGERTIASQSGHQRSRESRALMNGSTVETRDSVEVSLSLAAVMQDLRSEYQGFAAETKATAQELASAMPSSPVPAWMDVGLIDSPGKVMDNKVMDKTNANEASQSGDSSPSAVTAIGRTFGSQITQAMDFLRITVPESVPRG